MSDAYRPANDATPGFPRPGVASFGEIREGMICQLAEELDAEVVNHATCPVLVVPVKE